MGICILLVSVISYNVGKINALQKTPIKITSEEVDQANVFKATAKESKVIKTTITKAPPTDLRVVVSKKSTTKKYHYTWCSGSQRIKEENKLWFNSAQEAEAAGYTLAGNCQL